MLAVLDKVTIKSEILPYLSTMKRGFETKSCLIEIINAILYKLKTGCQWEHLSIEALVTTTDLSHGAERFRKRIETIFSQLNDNLMMYETTRNNPAVFSPTRQAKSQLCRLCNLSNS